MKYQCCDHMLGSTTLIFEGFRICNEVQGCSSFYVPYDAPNAFEKFEEQRKNIIKGMQKGDIPDSCNGCPMLVEKDWKEYDGEVFKLTISNWIHCNISCFYCAVKSYTVQETQKSPHYNALPIIKKLIEQNRITSNTYVAFQGGEPTMLEEFPQIIDSLLDYNCRFEVLTNGIKYEPLIGKMLLKDKKNMVCISLDCGTSETYKRMKHLDAFNDVTSTIRQYIKDAQDNYAGVRIKYILFPNVNDSKKELDAFFDFCYDANVKTISRAVNYIGSDVNSYKPVEKSIIKAYQYFEEKALKYNMNMQPEPWADIIVQNKFYYCKNMTNLEKYKSNLYNLLKLKQMKKFFIL